MDYTEIKERLTACEIKLQALQNSNQDVKNTEQYTMAVKKLTVLKESLQKRLNEKIAVGPKTPKSDSSKIAAKLGVPSAEVNTAIDNAKKDKELVTVAEIEITTEDKIKAILNNRDRIEKAADAATDLTRKIAFHKGDTEHGKMVGNVRVYPKMHGVDEDLDIGHEDDEPSMVKKDLYDIINYAAKLYKQIDKYDGMDAEVDFPQWWQKKVILARDYMSAAQHYLESEEKQPAIDQLALEGYAGPSIDKMSRADMIDFLNLSAKVAKDMSDEDLRDAVKIKNSDMNEKTDYQKRREAESDYKTSKRDVPPKKYKQPKNDYFARRKAEMDEASHGKLQKDYDALVAKMKELAKLYKSGDTSVVGQLKDMTAKKKELEKKLDKAVGKIGVGQELSGEEE